MFAPDLARRCLTVSMLALAACERARVEPAPLETAAPSTASSSSSSSESEHRSTPAPPPAWRDWAVAHWLPGPATFAEPSPRRAALAERCHECHPTQHAQWQGSEHAGAWSSASFQRAFAREPLGFCQGCHAPEASPRERPPSFAAAVGVGCVSCHLEPGEARIWAAGETLELDAALGCVLPVSRSPAFAGPQACAACHEFEFPDGPLRREPLLMQSTIREHRDSSAADRSCVDCHMPEGRGHAFPGAHDRDMLRRALAIRAWREQGEVVVELRPAAVGHMVPTGDLFRRLEVELLEIDADGDSHTLGRRWLGRRFGPRPHPGGLTLRAELEDGRVGPEGRTLRFALPAAHAQPGPSTLRWRVVHQRVLHAGADPRRVVIDGQLEVASGAVE